MTIPAVHMHVQREVIMVEILSSLDPSVVAVFTVGLVFHAKLLQL